MIRTDKLVVIPSDPLSAYEKAGYLQKVIKKNYFNPKNIFNKCYIISPLEPQGHYTLGDLTVIGARGLNFLEIICNINPNLIRAYGGFWASEAAIYSASLASPNTPVYISIHDTNPDLLYNSALYADKIHCTSNVVKELVESKGYDNNYISIVPNWIDVEEFKKTSVKPNLPQNIVDFKGLKPILHIGRKVEQKNLETVIASLKFLPDEYIAIFIGAGNDDKYIYIASKLNVSHRCFFIDKIENSELYKWYSWAHVMCTPSRWEGFGIVFIEAASCGCNIVTSDIPPINEILTNNKDAILVKEYENPKEIAKAILMYEDKYFSQNVSKEAILTARKYNIDRIQEIESESMIKTKLRPKTEKRKQQIRALALRYFNK